MDKLFDVDQVIEGLTKAQRRLLLDAFYTSRWRIERHNAALDRLGLLLPCSSFLSNNGLAVRERLLSREEGGEGL